MKVTQDFLDSLTAVAKVSSRLRANFDLRNSPSDQSQRMLNAIEPGSPVPIHRHPTTSETVICLRGRIAEDYFNEVEGRVIESIELSPDGDVCALSIPAGQWHTVRSLESGTVIVEFKEGRYEPLRPEDCIMI